MDGFNFVLLRIDATFPPPLLSVDVKSPILFFPPTATDLDHEGVGLGPGHGGRVKAKVLQALGNVRASDTILVDLAVGVRVGLNVQKLLEVQDKLVRNAALRAPVYLS
jgi:hypothetical protein